jgi:DNA-binding beta-propeller fold protein YncE
VGAANTVYTVNTGDNELSVVNGRTCSMATTSGCHGLFPSYPTLDVGREPSALAVNQRTHTVYVANYSNGTRYESVSVV